MDKTLEQITAELCTPILPVYERAGGRGATLKYHKGYQIIDRLNAVFGIGGWHFSINDHWTEGGDAIVSGTLSFNLPGEDLRQYGFNHSLEDIGSVPITAGLTAGDAYKGAVTDLLKRLAYLLGVGKELRHDPSEDALKPVAAKPIPPCSDCGGKISGVGNQYAASDVYRLNMERYNLALCADCSKKRQAPASAEPANAQLDLPADTQPSGEERLRAAISAAQEMKLKNVPAVDERYDDAQQMILAATLEERTARSMEYHQLLMTALADNVPVAPALKHFDYYAGDNRALNVNIAALKKLMASAGDPA